MIFVSKIKLEEVLCFVLPISIGMTFPLQVLFNNTLVGGVSSIILALLFVTSLFRTRGKIQRLRDKSSLDNWDWFVFVIVLFCAVNAIAKFLVGEQNMFSDLYLLLQGIAVYFFFSRIAKNGELTSFLRGLLLFSIISTIFYVSESIYKISFGGTFDYTLQAFEYSRNSLNQTMEEANTFRIRAGYRSFGLLERHTTSALWIVFGVFTALLLAKRSFTKIFFLGVGFLSLLIVQNFTALVVFVLVTLVSYRLKTILMALLMTVFIGGVGLLSFASDQLMDFVRMTQIIMATQFETAFSYTAEKSGNSYISLIIYETGRYWSEVVRNPFQLFFGFGVGTNLNFGTSGDVGFFESALRLGLPLWLLLTGQLFLHAINVFRRRTLLTLQVKDNLDAKILFFSAQILISIWLMDLHYSAWINKSVWPILFFAMALAKRPFKLTAST